MDKFKYESYRQPWETGPQWELKREFLEKYSEMFDEDRLLCLAQAYSNVVLMNCSYPDQVMQQINHLSKPLQMRKKFQEGNNYVETGTHNNQEQRVSEKMKAIYQASGRPFKQIKFCSSDKSNSAASSELTNLHENVPKQPESVSPLPMSNQLAEPVSTSTVITSTYVNNGNPPRFQINENIFVEEETEERIVRTLGLEFIRKLAQVIRHVHPKCQTAQEAFFNSANRLKIQDRITFKIDLDPDTPQHLANFSAKLHIATCEIASGQGHTKKKAKIAAVETAVNVLIKLSSSRIYEKRPIRQLTYARHRNYDPMTVLEMFSEKIVNRIKEEPAIVALKSIASLLDMEDLVRFDIVSDPNSSKATQYTCKFFIKDILISCGKDNTAKTAKVVAIDSGFIRLSNLSDYKIHNGELKAQNNTNKTSNLEVSNSRATASDIATENFEKAAFILNKDMFDLSLKEGFVLLDKVSYNIEFQKNFRNVISESAGFCHKKFAYDYEDILTTTPPSKKALVSIGDEVVGTGIAFTKNEAKTIACTRAVKELRKKYYTLKVKNEYVEGYVITRSQVYDGKSFSSSALTDDNIGCKMLKNMGWSGGGLGTDGISEPVEAHAQHSFGSGLGFSKEENDLKLFKKNLDAVLSEFSKTVTYSDLVFSKDFTKDERKEIHKLSVKYGLHTHSRGVNDDRFISIRHKYDVTKLLTYLANNGGSNSKFELVDASKVPFVA